MRADQGASPVLTAVVSEFSKKAEKAAGAEDERAAVIELEHYGVPFERGPDELADLPQYLGHGGRPPDFSKYDLNIFAESVDATALKWVATLAPV